LTGKGEIIAIADSGIDTGESATLHLDFRDRVESIKSYPIKASLTPYVSNPGGDDGASDSYSGHGTHVAGSALGSGEQAKELGLANLPTGMAPEAQLVFQAIEQTPNWNQQGQLLWLNTYLENPPKSGLFGIPDDLEQLFQDAYDRGARIHSNSWGGGAPGVYDSQCADLDRFVRENPDFLVIVAAGNDGKHTSSGIRGIDQGSVTSPGTAKNCLTIGASENQRGNQFSDTYGNWWPDKFPHLPFKSDNMADSTDHIAAFSSRGPCQNGYRKPDLIAPGTFILSTRSSQIPNNNFGWGAYPLARKHYMYMGGTSMATPLVAGCAALVRQYLKEKYQPSISNPSAALVKAILIHSAQYIKYRYAHPASVPWADNEQGWGRVNLQKVLNPAAGTKVIFIDEANGLTTGENREYKLKITKSSVPLKVNLVYTDYPGEDLINNLNLIVHSPSGKHYLGNDFEETGTPDNINNVEGVVVKSPEIGEWRIEIVADVQMGQQDYAVVISGGGALRVS
jgi:serine protease AprX